MQRAIVIIIICIAVVFIARKIWKAFTSQATGHCGGGCSTCTPGDSLSNVDACTQKSSD